MNIKKVNALLTTLKTYKARSESPEFITLSDGNKKLVSNERVSFLIWNIPAVITCPYRTHLCEKYCYARAAENIYPEALPSRLKHLEISKRADFIDRMIFTIQAELDRPRNKNKKVVFRIHESGDFYNLSYAKKWLQIIQYFENNNNICFVAYTKSVVFFDGIEIPKNLFLLASVWADTTEKNLEIIKRNNFRVYTAFKGPELETALKNGYSFCPCKDCGTCGKCWNNYINNVVCEIH